MSAFCVQSPPRILSKPMARPKSLKAAAGEFDSSDEETPVDVLDAEHKVDKHSRDIADVLSLPDEDSDRASAATPPAILRPPDSGVADIVRSVAQGSVADTVMAMFPPKE